MILFSNEVKNMKELEKIVKDSDLVSKYNCYLCKNIQYEI